jgi:hypothetical protein
MSPAREDDADVFMPERKHNMFVVFRPRRIDAAVEVRYPQIDHVECCRKRQSIELPKEFL